MARIRAHNLFILFLTRLTGWFVACSVILTGIILASHYLITLRFLLPGMVTPQVLVMLLPQMFGHGLPVALCMSVGLVTHHLMQSHEQFMIECLYGVRRAWRAALGGVIAGAVVVFFLCIGWWGPHYYRCAKQELVARVARLVQVIPPRKTMEVTPTLRLWYEKKEYDDRWCNARFLVRDEQRTLSLAASSARLSSDSFHLLNGSLYQEESRHSSYHEFGEMILPYDVSGDVATLQLRPKHATLSQLWARREERAMRKEIARRCFHALLFVAAPFVMLFLVRAVQVHRLLVIVIGSIGLTAIMQLLKECAGIFV